VSDGGVLELNKTTEKSVDILQYIPSWKEDIKIRDERKGGGSWISLWQE
jgi:hypothetical protein